MKMKMRWKIPNQDPRRGTQKKREGVDANTNTPSPIGADPERAREKAKRRPTDTEQDQRRGGRQKHMNQPYKAKPAPT